MHGQTPYTHTHHTHTRTHKSTQTTKYFSIDIQLFQKCTNVQICSLFNPHNTMRTNHSSVAHKNSCRAKVPESILRVIIETISNLIGNWYHIEACITLPCPEVCNVFSLSSFLYFISFFYIYSPYISLSLSLSISLCSEFLFLICLLVPSRRTSLI